MALRTSRGAHAVEPCGNGCDSWNRYEEDLDLIVDLGLNSFRLSVEWARIKPEREVISRDALDHYRSVLEACQARSILPVVTLRHFTLPRWVADLGGFECPETPALMGDYTGVVGAALGDGIAIACTINELNIVPMRYLIGVFPLAQRSRERFVEVNTVMWECHLTMGDALRATSDDCPIGLPLSMNGYEALPSDENLVQSF